MRRFAMIGAALVLGAGSAFAQPAPATMSLAPPATTDQRMISLDGALAVLAAAEQQARTLHAPAALAVVDATGDLVAFLRMDGTRPADIRLAIDKARTAARFRQPSEALTNLPQTADTTALPGGTPLMANGATIGAIGVSSTDRGNDQKIAEAGAASAK
jgi:glc operon protein GlcG